MKILPLQLAVCEVYYESDPFSLIIQQHMINNSGIHSFLIHTTVKVMDCRCFFFNVVSQYSTNISCSTLFC